MGPRICEERARQPPVDGIKPLPRQRNKILQLRQPARGRLQMRAHTFERAADGRSLAERQFLDGFDQLGIFRYRPFCGFRGRRRAGVGNEIDQGPIGFVADGGDQRNAAFGGGADDDFLIEAPEIFKAAASARDDQNIGAQNFSIYVQRVETADRGGDLGGAAFALHADGPQQNARRIALVEAVQHVADDGARW